MATTLQVVVPGLIWHATQDTRIGPLRLQTRATFVRLDGKDIWVHSPIDPTEALLEELARVGTVRFVIAPNRSHHLFFDDFLAACPDATGFIAPGLDEKRPELKGHAVLDHGAQALWAEHLEGVLIEGLPVLNETVWFHRASGTVILADLLFSFAPRALGATRIVARSLGVYDRLGMSRTMKVMVRDRTAFARSVDRIRQWDVKRIILGHDQIIDRDAAARLHEAFEWLPRPP